MQKEVLRCKVQKKEKTGISSLTSMEMYTLHQNMLKVVHAHKLQQRHNNAKLLLKGETEESFRSKKLVLHQS